VYGYGHKQHRNDGLDAHEILRNKKVQEMGIGNGSDRVKGNPSIALSRENHKMVHTEERRLRAQMGLGANDMLKSSKAEIRLMNEAIHRTMVKFNIMTMQQLRTARRMAERWIKTQRCK